MLASDSVHPIDITDRPCQLLLAWCLARTTPTSAMATAAAALIGLLFVAVSVRDDTIFGPNAMPGGEALAITAFTGLVNSFVVSLLGLIPKINIGEPAVIMAVISIVAIVRLQRRLHTGRNLIVLAITLLAYAAQFGLVCCCSLIHITAIS